MRIRGYHLLDQSSRDFPEVDAGLQCHVQMNFDTSVTSSRLLQDVSERVKNREIDLLIVVNMP